MHYACSGHMVCRSSLLWMCSVLLLNQRSSMRPQHGLVFALLAIETDLTRFFVDVLSWVTETSPHHLLRTSLVTVMNSYFQGLTLTASIYSSSTCLIDPVLSFVFGGLPEPNRACPPTFLIWNNLCDLVYQTPTKSYQHHIPVAFSIPDHVTYQTPTRHALLGSSSS